VHNQLCAQANIHIKAREDPMPSFVARKSESRREQLDRVAHLKRIMAEIREIESDVRKSKKRKKHSHHKKKKRSSS
jgi:hypothetical protein